MSPQPRAHSESIDALTGAAALATRWIERLLAAHEPPLTVAQFLALRSIDRERITAAELARRAGVSGPAVSQLVAALEREGWIARSPVAGDRRLQELALTEGGRLQLRSTSAALHEQIAPLLEQLPRPELNALERVLSRLEAALAGTPPPRRPPPPPRPEGRRPGRR